MVRKIKSLSYLMPTIPATEATMNLASSSSGAVVLVTRSHLPVRIREGLRINHATVPRAMPLTQSVRETIVSDSEGIELTLPFDGENEIQISARILPRVVEELLLEVTASSHENGAGRVGDGELLSGSRWLPLRGAVTRRVTEGILINGDYLHRCRLSGYEVSDHRSKRREQDREDPSALENAIHEKWGLNGVRDGEP